MGKHTETKFPKKKLSPGIEKPEHDPNWVIVGRFARAFGIKGEIIVDSFTSPLQAIANYQQYFLYSNNQWQNIELSFPNNIKKQITTRIKDINSPEDARHYTGYFLGIERQELPELPENEYYWHDLITLQVYNLEQKSLGTVSYITDTGAHPILVTHCDNKKRFIPYTPEIVKTISLPKKTIVADWPEDL